MGDATTGNDGAEPVSRRRFGRAVLLGGAAAGAMAVGDAPAASAAPVTDTWKLGGNSGVTEATNFIGTKDNKGLVVRTNNAERMHIDPNGRTGIGTPALNSTKLAVRTPDLYYGAFVVGRDTGVAGQGRLNGLRGGATGTGSLGEGSGVHGGGDSARGVTGYSQKSDGVMGFNDGGGAVAGVRGTAFGTNGNGVIGTANTGSGAYGVWGVSTGGYAGYFSGRVNVSGVLTKSAGSFRIDHPLDPDHKYLSHSFVESPDMMNVYNGNVRTNGKGEARVTMPDYFEALNTDFRYQLTPIGQFAQVMVSSEIANGSFTIKTDKPNVKVSWQVTGVRQDAFARANRIPVVEDKPGDQHGTRLHPEAFGLPAERGVDNARLVGLEAASMPLTEAAPEP